jgi:hypothetical protein
VAPAAPQAPRMTGDNQPAIAAPLTNGFARTSYELDQMAAAKAASRQVEEHK